MKLPFAESYKIKMVESIRRSTREERNKEKSNFSKIFAFDADINLLSFCKQLQNPFLFGRNSFALLDSSK